MQSATSPASQRLSQSGPLEPSGDRGSARLWQPPIEARGSAVSYLGSNVCAVANSSVTGRQEQCGSCQSTAVATGWSHSDAEPGTYPCAVAAIECPFASVCQIFHSELRPEEVDQSSLSKYEGDAVVQLQPSAQNHEGDAFPFAGWLGWFAWLLLPVLCHSSYRAIASKSACPSYSQHSGLFRLLLLACSPLAIRATDLPLRDTLRELLRQGPSVDDHYTCLLYTSPSPRDGLLSRMPSSA